MSDPAILNDLKTKVDDLDVGKLKAVFIDLKKIKWCSEEWSCEEHKIQYAEDIINELGKKISDVKN